MSDEREKRYESDEPGEESEEVEAHKLLQSADDAGMRAANDEGDDDDVEAHVKLSPKNLNP